MAAFLQEMGTNTPVIANISWYVAVDTYIAHQKMRSNLKPRALESALFQGALPLLPDWLR